MKPAMSQVFNARRIQSRNGCNGVTAPVLLNEVTGEGDCRTGVVCHFQQYQVMFYKPCFLFSSALVEGYKITLIIFKRKPLNATG